MQEIKLTIEKIVAKTCEYCLPFCYPGEDSESLESTDEYNFASSPSVEEED